MMTTSPSLLVLLRQANDFQAWERFVQLYTPLMYHWARRLGLQEHDAADLVQDVFTILVRKLPEFQYDPNKGFRNWLYTIFLNKWRQRARVGTFGEAGNDLDHLPAPEDRNTVDEIEYRRYLVSRALHLMQTEFAPNTWKACWEHVVVGREASDVAAELGISAGAVYVAKSRVMCRLRQALAGLLD